MAIYRDRQWGNSNTAWHSRVTVLTICTTIVTTPTHSTLACFSWAILHLTDHPIFPILFVPCHFVSSPMVNVDIGGEERVWRTFTGWLDVVLRVATRSTYYSQNHYGTLATFTPELFQILFETRGTSIAFPIHLSPCVQNRVFSQENGQIMKHPLNFV